MIVKAKCVARAWDNDASEYFYPSEVYEIPHDGKLASLKTGRGWVFEFDRTMAGTGCSPAIGGFACKKCTQVFDNLNELGNHSNSAHRGIEERFKEDVPDDMPILKDGRGRKKGRTFTCKTCGEVQPNLYALRVHNKSHVTAETVAVPA